MFMTHHFLTGSRPGHHPVGVTIFVESYPEQHSKKFTLPFEEDERLVYRVPFARKMAPFIPATP